MLKSLILLKLKGLWYQTSRSTNNKKNSLWKAVLFVLLFGYVGVVFLGMFYVTFDALVEPLQQMNVLWCYFAYMAIMIISICFLGSVFITYNEIYEGKDNEMLMSLPIKTSDILLSRVSLILIVNYMYEFVIGAPALYIYMTRVGMNLFQVFIFLLVFITLPLFVLALSCFFGWILAHILVHVRNRNIVTLVLSIGFFVLYFKFVLTLQEDLMWILMNTVEIAEVIKTFMFPLYHLANAIMNSNLMSLIIYLMIVLIPFVVVVQLLSKNYIRLATSKPKTKRKEYKESQVQTQSLMQALILREIRHFISHALIILNGGMSIIFHIIIIIVVIINKQTIQSMLVLMDGIDALIPWIICLGNIGIISLNLISAALISLEGKNFYILKTLPITSKQILDSKILLSLVLFTPTTIIATIVCSLVFMISIVDMILCLVLSVLFVLFVALIGLILNLCLPKFDYINDVVCIKSSIPSIMTMFLCMGISVLLGFIIVITFGDFHLVTFMMIVIVVFAVIDGLLYYCLNTWGAKKLNSL